MQQLVFGHPLTDGHACRFSQRQLTGPAILVTTVRGAALIIPSRCLLCSLWPRAGVEPGAAGRIESGDAEVQK
jgi:hypothetical protein